MITVIIKTIIKVPDDYHICKTSDNDIDFPRPDAEAMKCVPAVRPN